MRDGDVSDILRLFRLAADIGLVKTALYDGASINVTGADHVTIILRSRDAIKTLVDALELAAKKD